MDFLNQNKSMALPTQIPPENDWKFFFEWIFGWISSSSIIIYLIRMYFRDRREAAERIATAKKVETEEFIQKVAIACVKATINGVLDEVNKKVDVLFAYREQDRTHYDQRFDNLMKEIKK